MIKTNNALVLKDKNGKIKIIKLFGIFNMLRKAHLKRKHVYRKKERMETCIYTIEETRLCSF